MRREQDQAAGKPRSRIHNHISNHPVQVIEVEILDMPDFAVCGPK
jgi:hypothetical protein